MRKHAVAKEFNHHNHMWKLVALSEIAGFAYLFWAISYAAHISLANF